jgi:hypothetical protein
MATSPLGSLGAAPQLRDAQDRLRAASVTIARLEDENARLREALAMSRQQGPAAVDVDAQRGLRREVVRGADGEPSADTAALMRELKVQLVEATKRSADLERMLNERTAIQRRQYEAHIDALELELRRAKAGGRQLPSYSTGPTNPSLALSPTAFTTTNAGRTVETRKNLL